MTFLKTLNQNNDSHMGIYFAFSIIDFSRLL